MESRNANPSPPPAPILLYIPAPHEGHFELFERHAAQADSLWLVGKELATEFAGIHTEIRAIEPETLRVMFGALGRFREVRVLDTSNAGVTIPQMIVTASQEVISHRMVERYFPESEIIWDSVFLRYDQGNVKSITPVSFDRESHDLFDQTMMKLAFDEAHKSSDWWRHVGAVVVKNGQVVAVGYNHSVPSLETPYLFGNPRDFIEAGTMSQFSDAMHAEKEVFAQILHQGVSMSGADLYVSTFPCPDCAKLIAYSGVRRCFFASGHASLDGERVLKRKNVELIYVPTGLRA